MELIYFDIAHAIKEHDFIIENSGGKHGIINIGILESPLEHIKNDIYYPTIESKITHLLYSANKNHAFIDGNKRTSIVLSAYFMELNGFDFQVARFIIEMENIVVYVAENRINKELLCEIICSLLYELEYSEELKLKIIHALEK
jgi:death-on-curing protein